MESETAADDPLIRPLGMSSFFYRIPLTTNLTTAFSIRFDALGSFSFTYNIEIDVDDDRKTWARIHFISYRRHEQHTMFHGVTKPGS